MPIVEAGNRQGASEIKSKLVSPQYGLFPVSLTDFVRQCIQRIVTQILVEVAVVVFGSRSAVVPIAPSLKAVTRPIWTRYSSRAFSRAESTASVDVSAGSCLVSLSSQLDWRTGWNSAIGQVRKTSE